MENSFDFLKDKNVLIKYIDNKTMIIEFENKTYAIDFQENCVKQISAAFLITMALN